MSQIEDDVRSVLAGLGVPARVVTQLAPAWTTDWMSDRAREKLRAYGIAPPQCATPDRPGNVTAVLRFVTRPVSEANVPCPHCGSSETTEISHFGSTACKAQYRCLACLEPFDYFKPY